MGLPPHSVTHISGGSDEINHNLLAGLQGGSGGQYYHLSSGQYFNLVTGTGSFYPNNNPSGFITGVDLSPYATITYVTGISGQLQAQITVLNNQTGSYVLNSQTGQFYSSSNPSGFITGVDLSFSGNYYTKTESESRYVNVTGAETILGDKTFHDKVYINNLYVTGLETIVNTTNTNVASNYIMLNLTGGAVDGGIFFVTGSGLTGINDSGAIIGFDHSDKFKFGIGTRASDLSTLSTIASFSDVTGASGNLQTQINTLNSATGSYILDSEAGQFYSSSNPSGYTATGYVTGVSGNLQTQITTLNNQTGSFYPNTNPSGYISGISNLVFTTGNQTISGAKTFANNLTVNGGDLFVDTSNNRVGIGTASPITTLDVNGSGLFRSGLNANLIISTGSPLNILGKDNATQAFPGNFIGASINLNAGSGNFIPGFISLKAGAHPTSPGAISLNGGLAASNIPEGKISLNSKSIEVNNNNSYASSTIFYKTGVPVATKNLDISQDSISIFNNLLINGNRPTVNSTGILLSGEATTQTYVTGISGGLQTQITTLNNQTGNYYTKDESESRYVNTTGAETILGNKTFHDNVYINNLYVTGLETVVNTTNTNVASNYIMLNLTGGAVDGGIFFITGSGLTGINDSGAIIGFDHSDEFKFGVSTRASDLSTLNTIASVEQMTGISGSLQTQISTLNNQTGGYVLNSQTGDFYANSNPSGFITGINNLVYTTGDQSVSGNINISGNLTISGVYNIYQQIENAKILAIAYAIAL
jgi:hypothetical protein